MTRSTLAFFLVAVVGVGLIGGIVVGQTGPASRAVFPEGVVSAGGIEHTLLVHSPVLGKVFKVGGNGEVVGEYEIGKKGEDSWWLANGRVLGSYAGGVREIDAATGKVTWEYHAGVGAEVHSCQPVEEGRVLICECGTKRLFEINRDLSVAWEIKLESSQVTHKQFRLARKTEAGTYLVTYGSDAVAREFDKGGKVLRTFVLPARKNGGADGAIRLANGNTLVTGGYGAEAYEFDVEGKIVWTLGQADMPSGFMLHYLGSVEQLANGNRVFSNFQGEPGVFEVDQGKRVVWQYHSEKVGAVSAVEVLDGK